MDIYISCIHASYIYLCILGFEFEMNERYPGEEVRGDRDQEDLAKGGQAWEDQS